MSTVFNFTFVPWFRSVAPYIHKFRHQTFVVGLTGEAIAAGKLHNIAQDLAMIKAMGVKIVLVHGFRPQVNEQLLHLTPLELIDRIAALVPPPRTHRHRYFGVLAPNSPLRAAVTALATPAQAAPVLGASISTGECAPGVVPMSSALPSQSEPVLPKRAAHYLWAVLIARIYEVFPLLCPLCGGQMRIIAFITHSADIRHILDHIGADSEPPRISPARGPPLWEGCDAPVDDGAQGEPDWDLAAQPAPDYEVDQRVNW